MSDTEQGIQRDDSAAGKRPESVFRRIFGPSSRPGYTMLWARWIFLRALGLIFFSAFYPLLFQIRGLIGPEGILPADRYLASVRTVFPSLAFWYAPTLLWLGSSEAALTGLVIAGLVFSLTLTLNLWPRLSIALCFVLFLSFVAAADVFSSYQSDGMLLEAAFLSLFFAPAGLRPGLGAASPPSRASLFLLQWLWFRILFESGLVKILSGETQWRDMTAMADYYQNGPLPTWLGWYADKLPEAVHAASAVAVLGVELVLPWLVFLPLLGIRGGSSSASPPDERYRLVRRFRLFAFAVTALMQIVIILTANYTFLNYLVLALSFLFLDDRIFVRRGLAAPPHLPARRVPSWRMAGSAVILCWVLYASVAGFVFLGGTPNVLSAPAVVLQPFRIANNYGLFAVMTRGRYEIEFQGSRDGRTWVAYPFQFKPQELTERPGIYAPYQPRLDWNLWFASLTSWRQQTWVLNTQSALLEGSPPVLDLFAGNPFAEEPPQLVRAVLWQYWFSDRATRRETGQWWRRELLGSYAPTLQRLPDGRNQALEPELPPAPPRM